MKGQSLSAKPPGPQRLCIACPESQPLSRPLPDTGREGIIIDDDFNKKDVEAFRELGYHVARGVFGRDEITRLREGYDYILELASRRISG